MPSPLKHLNLTVLSLMQKGSVLSKRLQRAPFFVVAILSVGSSSLAVDKADALLKDLHAFQVREHTQFIDLTQNTSGTKYRFGIREFRTSVLADEALIDFRTSGVGNSARNRANQKVGGKIPLWCDAPSARRPVEYSAGYAVGRYFVQVEVARKYNPKLSSSPPTAAELTLISEFLPHPESLYASNRLNIPKTLTLAKRSEAIELKSKDGKSRLTAFLEYGSDSSTAFKKAEAQKMYGTFLPKKLPFTIPDRRIAMGAMYDEVVAGGSRTQLHFTCPKCYVTLNLEIESPGKKGSNKSDQDLLTHTAKTLCASLY